MNTITINNKEVSKKEFEGLPVITVDMIANIHEKPYKYIFRSILPPIPEQTCHFKLDFIL